jgi:TPR repeat protein
VKWYRLAAAQGHANAQASLCALHHNGEGIDS